MGKLRVRRVVAETHAAGASVSVVARRHDINANLLFRWRDDPRYVFQEQRFLPIEVSMAVEDRKPAGDPREVSEIGIWIAGDVRLVVKGGYAPEALGHLIRTIRAVS